MRSQQGKRYNFRAVARLALLKVFGLQPGRGLRPPRLDELTPERFGAVRTGRARNCCVVLTRCIELFAPLHPFRSRDNLTTVTKINRNQEDRSAPGKC